MNWEHDKFVDIYTARSGEVILEVVPDYGFWYYDIELETGARIVSPSLYDTADAAKLAAQHALDIWRKGETA
jgi:microcystin degradation protein MlrC